MMFFCSSFIVFQHVSIWHALLRALWHMTLDSEMNCRPIWGRSRMISPPSLASRGQTHRVWSTWLSWCRNDHEILLVVYHCARFLGKHRRCARGLYFCHFSYTKKSGLLRSGLQLQWLRKSYEEMWKRWRSESRKSRISSFRFSTQVRRVNSTSVASTRSLTTWHTSCAGLIDCSLMWLPFHESSSAKSRAFVLAAFDDSQINMSVSVYPFFQSLINRFLMSHRSPR